MTITRITATAERGAPIDNPEPNDWRENATGWTVTLIGETDDETQPHRLTLPFWQGPAIPGPPTARDVLECIASDASAVADGQTFEEWCDEYGEDTDSRAAERTYKAVVAQTERLRAFLGDRPTFDAIVFSDPEEWAKAGIEVDGS